MVPAETEPSSAPRRSGVLQGLLELDNARLVEPRLLAGGVVAGVLPQVTLLAGRFHALGDLLALGRLAVLELGGQPVVGLLSEPGAL